MKLENGYVVMYEATRENVGERKLYASKVLQGIEEKMLKGYNATTGEEVDLTQFKLIYADREQKHLMGSLETIPTENDIHISIYDEENNLVFGCDDVPPVPPTPKYEVSAKVPETETEKCVVGGAGEYVEGAEVKITVKPAEGYRFAEGNAPKVGEEAMVEDGEEFKYEFVMGAEAKEIIIEGVVVEAIPEPLKAGIRLYTAINDEHVEPVLDMNADCTVLNPEEGVRQVEGLHPDVTADNCSLFVAFDTELGESLTGIYDISSAFPNQNILDNYEAKEDTIYEEKTFKVYVFKDTSDVILTHTFKFVF